MERLSETTRIAVDTEFHAERRYFPKLYLVQLNLDDATTWIVDPLQPGQLETIGPALRARPWVVHGGTQDMRLLNLALGGLPERVWDTQIAAGLVTDRFPEAYKDLLRTFAGIRVNKGATLSDWSRRPLHPEQLRYAADDVKALFRLWDTLWERVEALDRSGVAADACDAAKMKVLEPPDAWTVWRSIPAATVLSRQEAAILQELAAWRERRARTLDQPPMTLANNATLVDLSRRQPITRESLSTNRRLGKSVIKKHGDVMIEAISRAQQRAEWAWPRPIAEASAEGRRVAWLECLGRALGAQHSWAARLVLPRPLLEDLVTETGENDVSLKDRLGSWRYALCGEVLEQALSGQVSLRLSAGDVHTADAPATLPGA